MLLLLALTSQAGATPAAGEPPRVLAMRYGVACAVTSGGRVACWERGAPALVEGIDGAVEVAVGMQNACARTADGRVACWGDNVYRELGPGGPSRSAVWIGGLPPAVELGTRTYGTPCIRAADGGVWCWGRTVSTSITSTDAGYVLNVPEEVDSLSGAKRLVVGHDAVCSVGTSVRCIGGVMDRSPGADHLPNPLAEIAAAREVAFGFTHACLLRADGHVACWGENAWGELGDGTTTTRLQPVDVPGIADAVRVVVGPMHTCVLHATGRVSCMGAPAQTPATARPTVGLLTPTDMGITDAVDVGAGWGQSCALLRDRSLVCWGYKRDGVERIGALE